MEALKEAIDARKISLSHVRHILSGDENLRSFLESAENYPKYSPLHHAVAKDHWELSKLLIEEFRVNPNATCKYGDGDRATVLHIAAYFGSENCLRQLLNWSGPALNPNLVGMFEGCAGTPAEVAKQRNHR